MEKKTLTLELTEDQIKQVTEFAEELKKKEEDDKSVDLSKYSEILKKTDGIMIVSVTNPYKGKGIYLNNIYNWELVNVYDDMQYLIPTKK